MHQLPPPLRRLMMFERFYLHNTDDLQISSRDLTFDRRYFPQNCSPFELPCFWISRKHFYVEPRGTTPSLAFKLVEGSPTDGRVLFPVHPAELDKYRSYLDRVGARRSDGTGPPVWAVPTSSTRTLLVWPDQEPERALFIKLSLHSPILGDRHIYRRRIQFCTAMSTLIRDSLSALPLELQYLPESLGFTPRQMTDHGVIAREIPADFYDENLLIAPLFSLLGGSPSYQPLFITIVKKTGMSALELVERVFCSHIPRIWLTLALRFGLILELHGQDILLALSKDLTPLDRYFYRDLEGLNVDWDLRRRLGLRSPHYLPGAGDWHNTYASSGSGFPCSSLTFWKLLVNLGAYAHFVLGTLDSLLLKWQENGDIRHSTFSKGDVLRLFSFHVLRTVECMFGVRVSPEHSPARSMRKFVMLLMTLRDRNEFTSPALKFESCHRA